MKYMNFAAIAVVTLMFSPLASAQQQVPTPSCSDVSYEVCCTEGCGMWSAGADLLLLRYHREGGVSVNNGAAEFDFDPAYRVHLAYTDCDGFGARVTYFDYEALNINTATANGNTPLGVETYNIDLELFQQLELGHCTRLEISGGIRYNDFQEIATTVNATVPVADFEAFGGIIGARVERDMSFGTLYAGYRYAVMMDDFSNPVAGQVLTDHVASQSEISFGVRREVCIAGMRGMVDVGVEWWKWDDYVTGSINVPAVNSFQTNDIGFAGGKIGFTMAF